MKTFHGGMEVACEIDRKDGQLGEQSKHALAALSFQNGYYTASESSSIASDVDNTEYTEPFTIKDPPSTTNRDNLCFFDLPTLFGVGLSEDEAYNTCDEGAESLLSSPRRTDKGVTLDPFLGKLLGISYLPFTDTFRTARSSFAPINDNFLNFSSRNNSIDQESRRKNFMNGSQTKKIPTPSLSGDYLVELKSGDENEKKKKKKNPARKAMNKLKKGLSRKKINKNNSSPPKSRTSTPSVASITSSTAISDSYISIPTLVFSTAAEGTPDETLLAENGLKKLAYMQANIAQIKSQSKNLQMQSELCKNRIQTLLHCINELESRLESLSSQLQTEYQTLKRNIYDISMLEKNRKQLEQEEGNLNETLKTMPSTYKAESSTLNSKIRDRTNTVDSFMTANALTAASISVRDDQLSESKSKVDEPTTQRTSQPLENSSPLTRSSSFLRVHDLGLQATEETSHRNNCANINGADNLDSTRSDLFSLDRNDRQLVFDALCNKGYKYATDEGPRWSPDKGTERILAKQDIANSEWKSAPGKNILVWSGKIDDEVGGFGSNIPIIKSRGNIAANAHKVMDLLVDSSRVKEYNKMSLGRTDKFCYSDSNVNSEVVVSKVIHSLSKPPLIRKNIELVSLIHARKLNEVVHNGHKGYIVVSRSVWENEFEIPDENGKRSTSTGDAIRSEMLLSVNFIREIDNDVAELTTVTHLFTPGIPTFGAKKIALTAAANFVRDIQRIFEK